MLSPSHTVHTAAMEYLPWHPDRVTQDSKLPIALMIYFLTDIIFSLANFLSFIRYQEGRYGRDFVKAYLAFVVLGIIFFAVAASVLWVWAARYSLSHKERRRRTALGVVVVFLSNVLPLFILEYHAVLCCPWVGGLQGFCFVLKTLSFLGASVLVWLSYAWRAARFLEYHYPLVGTTMTDSRSSGMLSTPLMGVHTGPSVPMAADTYSNASGGSGGGGGAYRTTSPAPFGYGGSLYDRNTGGNMGVIPSVPMAADMYSNASGGSGGGGGAYRTTSPAPFGYGGSLYDGNTGGNMGNVQSYYVQPSAQIVRSPSHTSLYAERRGFDGRI